MKTQLSFLLGFASLLFISLSFSVFSATPPTPSGYATGGLFSVYFQNIVKSGGSNPSGICPSGQSIIGFSTGTSNYGSPICQSVISGGYWTQSGTDLFYTGGNVGIGTSTPTSMLDVAGNINASGLGVGSGLPSPTRGINLAVTYGDTGGQGIYNTLASNGTLSANRGKHGIYNLITNTTDNLDKSLNLYGILNYVNHTSTTTSMGARNFYGDFSQVYNNGTGNILYAFGSRGQVVNNTTGAIGNAYGNYALAQNSGGTTTNSFGSYSYVYNFNGGNITNAYGAFAIAQNNSSASTITNAYGGYFQTSQLAGTITNAYGVYIAPVGGTNTYGLYQYDSTNKNYFAGDVGIGSGASTPVTTLDVTNNPTNGTRGIASLYYANASSAPQINFFKSRGTPTAPTAIISGDVIGNLVYRAYDGTNAWGTGIASYGAQIRSLAAENWTSTNHGAYLTFETTSTGSTNVTERMRISENGVNVNSHRITNLATPVDSSDAATKAYVDALLSGAGNGDGSEIDTWMRGHLLYNDGTTREYVQDVLQLSASTYVILVRVTTTAGSTVSDELHLIDKTGFVGSVGLPTATCYGGNVNCSNGLKLFKFPDGVHFGVLHYQKPCSINAGGGLTCSSDYYVRKYNYALGLVASSPLLAKNSGWSGDPVDVFKDVFLDSTGRMYSIVYYKPSGGPNTMKVKRYTSSLALDTTFGTSGEMAYPLFTDATGEAKAYSGTLAAIRITTFSSGGQTWSRYELRDLSDFSLVNTVPISPGVRLVGNANGWFIGAGGQLYNSSLVYVGGLPMPYGAFAVPMYGPGEIIDLGGGNTAGLAGGRLTFYAGTSISGTSRILGIPFEKLGISFISNVGSTVYGVSTRNDPYNSTNPGIEVWTKDYTQ